MYRANLCNHEDKKHMSVEARFCPACNKEVETKRVTSTDVPMLVKGVTVVVTTTWYTCSLCGKRLSTPVENDKFLTDLNMAYNKKIGNKDVRAPGSYIDGNKMTIYVYDNYVINCSSHEAFREMYATFLKDIPSVSKEIDVKYNGKRFPVKIGRITDNNFIAAFNGFIIVLRKEQNMLLPLTVEVALDTMELWLSQ